MKSKTKNTKWQRDEVKKIGVNSVNKMRMNDTEVSEMK